MLTTEFSVQGTSLKSLRSHEHGVISRIHTVCKSTAQKLRVLGVVPGKPISLEQRSPRLIIRVGNHCHVLNDTEINAIYVRVVGC